MTYSKQPHRILRPFSEAERKGREGAKISINNSEEKPAAAPPVSWPRRAVRIASPPRSRSGARPMR